MKAKSLDDVILELQALPEEARKLPFILKTLSPEGTYCIEYTLYTPKLVQYINGTRVVESWLDILED